MALVMEHYGGYDWDRCQQESSLVLSALYLRIPDIHFKSVWGAAQMMAFYGNSMGGKGTGGKKLDDSKTFKWREFMPDWAVPARLREELQEHLLLAPHNCLAFSEALEQGDLANASWVLQVVTAVDSTERIHEVADRYREMMGREAGELEFEG